MTNHSFSRFATFLMAALAAPPNLPAAQGPGPAHNAALRRQGIHVIPRPAQIEPGEGRFTLTAQTPIRVSAETERMGRHLAQTLAPAMGFALLVTTDTSENGRAGAIELSLSRDARRFGDEGYALQVLVDPVLITAAKPAGLFYGCQTLRQLFPTQNTLTRRTSQVAGDSP